MNRNNLIKQLERIREFKQILIAKILGVKLSEKDKLTLEVLSVLVKNDEELLVILKKLEERLIQKITIAQNEETNKVGIN